MAGTKQGNERPLGYLQTRLHRIKGSHVLHSCHHRPSHRPSHTLPHFTTFGLPLQKPIKSGRGHLLFERWTSSSPSRSPLRTTSPCPVKSTPLLVPIGVHRLEVRPGLVSMSSVAGRFSGVTRSNAGRSSKRRETNPQGTQGTRESQESIIVRWSLNSLFISSCKTSLWFGQQPDKENQQRLVVKRLPPLSWRQRRPANPGGTRPWSKNESDESTAMMKQACQV